MTVTKPCVSDRGGWINMSGILLLSLLWPSFLIKSDSAIKPTSPVSLYELQSHALFWWSTAILFFLLAATAQTIITMGSAWAWWTKQNNLNAPSSATCRLKSSEERCWHRQADQSMQTSFKEPHRADQCNTFNIVSESCLRMSHWLSEEEDMLLLWEGGFHSHPILYAQVGANGCSVNEKKTTQWMTWYL